MAITYEMNEQTGGRVFGVSNMSWSQGDQPLASVYTQAECQAFYDNIGRDAAERRRQVAAAKPLSRRERKILRWAEKTGRI